MFMSQKTMDFEALTGPKRAQSVLGHNTPLCSGTKEAQPILAKFWAQAQPNLCLGTASFRPGHKTFVPFT